MTPTRPNQTEQDGEDTVAIRIDIGVLKGKVDAVQQSVESLTSKVDKQDNIKKGDLDDFKHFITDRMVEYRTGLQVQIDRIEVGKADKQELSDFKKQLAGYGAVALAIGAALFSFMLQRLK